MLTRALLFSGTVLATTSSTQAQWWQDSLSIPRTSFAATAVGDLAFFAGGWNPNVVAIDVVDVYDATEDSWQTMSLSVPRRGLAGATAGDKALFAGGRSPTSDSVDTVDIFDATRGVWSSAQLSAPRVWLAGASSGDLAFFAGGHDGTSSASDVVDVYDDSTGTWTTGQLSQARWDLVATAAAGKVFFAGGRQGLVASDVVDVLDVATGTWTVEHLSIARTNLSAVAVGQRVFFAGGYANGVNFDRVDVFDTTTQLWSTATLSESRGSILAAETGGLAIFAGGLVHISLEEEDGSVTVDIHDPATGTWTVETLSDMRGLGAAVTVGGRAFFAGGIQVCIPECNITDRVESYRPVLGANYCGPAVPNSTGLPARIEAYGSVDVATNQLDLTALDLPPGQFGYFVGGQTQGFVPNPGGSQGNLCLGGVIGRFVDQVHSTGSKGRFSIPVDLTGMPSPLQPVVQPGETWNFQAWFRDLNPNTTSNFTDGVSVVFQ